MKVYVKCLRCVQVMVSGLDDAPAIPPDPAECFTAAEALLPGKVPQPKPGELQVTVPTDTGILSNLIYMQLTTKVSRGAQSKAFAQLINKLMPT